MSLKRSRCGCAPVHIAPSRTTLKPHSRYNRSRVAFSADAGYHGGPLSTALMPWNRRVRPYASRSAPSRVDTRETGDGRAKWRQKQARQPGNRHVVAHARITATNCQTAPFIVHCIATCYNEVTVQRIGILEIA